METYQSINPGTRSRPSVRGSRWLRRLVLTVALMVGSVLAAHACIFTYTLVGADGSTRITPGSPAVVSAGETYRIDITMREDHGNCSLEPEDTMFLLDEARWRVNRETQPLVLLSEIVWEKVGATRYTSTIVFRVAESGEFDIDVIRECTRGGYHETLVVRAG